MIGLGVAFLVLLALATASGSANAKASGPLATVASGPPDPSQASTTVIGKSGLKWITQAAGSSGATIFVDVFTAPNGAMPSARVVRYSQAGTDQANRLYVGAPSDVNPVTLAAAMSDFSIQHATGLATSMPASIQQMVSQALAALTVDADGRIAGPVTSAGIQLATGLAGQIAAAGFPDAANALRAYITAASGLLPPVHHSKRLPLPDSIPADLQAKINSAIQNERDPAKLQAIVNALKLVKPQDAAVTNAIAMLEALILQVQTAQAQAAALKKIQDELNAKNQPVNPTPPAGEQPLLVEGMRGSAVATWQKIIGVTPDGKFGPHTYAATVAWQQANGLTADGKVGPLTWAKANSGHYAMPGAAPGQVTPMPTPPAPPPSGQPLLVLGASGNAVATWQKIIGATPDGKFGPNTLAATVAWQAVNGLTADGKVGPMTWAKANSGNYAMPAPSTPTYTPSPAPTTPAVTPNGSSAMQPHVLIRQGSTGPDVAAWQTAIGITPADGKFGPHTAAATMSWQRANGLPADGVVGPNTWNAAFTAGIVNGMIGGFLPEFPNGIPARPVPGRIPSPRRPR